MHQSQEWVICIPSFDRAETLRTKTLALLRAGHVPFSRVHVFADPKDFAKKSYHSLADEFDGLNIHCGKAGIAAQRNNISSTFSAGQRIIEMDDDISGIVITDTPESGNPKSKLAKLRPEQLMVLIDSIWALASEKGCSIWGVSTSSRSLFMSHTIQIGLIKCTGQFQGYVNSPDLKLSVQVMEDYERCFEFHRRRYKGLRLNFLALETRNREVGGCHSFFQDIVWEENNTVVWHPRAFQEKKSATCLQGRYGEFLKLVSAKCVQKEFAMHGTCSYYEKGPQLRLKQGLSTKLPCSQADSASWCMVQIARLCDLRGAVAMASTREEQCAEEDESQETRPDDIGFQVIVGFKVDQLRTRCRQLGLDASGAKHELMCRLLEKDFDKEKQKIKDAADKELAEQTKKVAKIAEEREQLAVRHQQSQLQLERERQEKQELRQLVVRHQQEKDQLLREQQQQSQQQLVLRQGADQKLERLTQHHQELVQLGQQIRSAGKQQQDDFQHKAEQLQQKEQLMEKQQEELRKQELLAKQRQEELRQQEEDLEFRSLQDRLRQLETMNAPPRSLTRSRSRDCRRHSDGRSCSRSQGRHRSRSRSSRHSHSGLRSSASRRGSRSRSTSPRPPMQIALPEQDRSVASSCKCAREGCTYCVTWHDGYCCKACEQGSGHGKKCDRKLFGQFIASRTSGDAAEMLAAGKGSAHKSVALAIKEPLSATGKRKIASQPWLAWMEDPASGPGLFLRCLLCQKWVLEDAPNDTEGYSGLHGESGPLNAKDHRKRLNNIAWYMEEMKAEKSKWHPDIA